MEAVFPRGKHALPPSNEQGKKYKKKIDNEASKKKSDFLFGNRGYDAEDDTGPKKRRIQSDTTTDGSKKSRRSVLELGGGGVVHKTDGESWIEYLGFSHFCAGFKLLAIVREVHEDLAVLSLPNQWTGYMLRKSFPCDSMLRVNQMLPVTIVKAELENTKSGVRRRIQVSCMPDKVNSPNEERLYANSIIRGQVTSVEDHGLLVDLGFRRSGFLSFDKIGGSYALYDDKQTTEKPPEHYLAEGRILDFMVVSSDLNTKIVALALPSHKSRVKKTLPATNLPTLQSLLPGSLVRAFVEEPIKNGLCVSFSGGAFRGAIEMAHLGSCFLPKFREPSSEWRTVFEQKHISARIIAVDPSSKIIRLSLLDHILNLRLPPPFPPTGKIVHDATVVRLDPGIGATLALPEPLENLESNFDPVSTVQTYSDGRRIQTVYVHMSRATDEQNRDTKAAAALFEKNFAPSTKHSVRILKGGGLIEGIAVGGTASKIVNAHVLSDSDLVPGKLYKQVVVHSILDSGGVVVDFGMGVRGVIPKTHLFDDQAVSEFRAKVVKAKYAEGAKVDVRVLLLENNRRCILTAKKSLVTSNEVISSFDDAKVGQRSMGYISKISKTGMHVTFYGGTYGLVSSTYLRKMSKYSEGILDYAVGDVIRCEVLYKKRVHEIPEENAIAETNTLEPSGYWELSLGIVTDIGEIDDAADLGAETIDIAQGQVIPKGSLRVLKFSKSTMSRMGSAIKPGFAVVEIDSKHITKNKRSKSHMLELKIAFDQLFDQYSPEHVISAEALDSLAASTLQVGKMIDQESIVLKGSKKSLIEYTTGMGEISTLSLRPSYIRAAKSSGDEKDCALLLGSKDEIFVGAIMQGYAAKIDDKYGAFIRFMDNLTGLVPKRLKGTKIDLYKSLLVQVVAVDAQTDKITKHKRFILREVTDGQSGGKTERNRVPLIGDRIETAVVVRVESEWTFMKILDASYASNRRLYARIHCTHAFQQKIEGNGETDDQSRSLPEDHPFSRWDTGDQISNLKVIRQQGRGQNGMMVDLCPEKMQEQRFGVGEAVRGVIAAVNVKEFGLSIWLGPSMKGFLRAVDMSNDFDTVKALGEKYTVGESIQCTISGEKGRNERRLTMLSLGEEEPKRGEIVVGRVNWNRVVRDGPALMVELHGGFVGRCCITELANPEDWEDFPFGGETPREKFQNGAYIKFRCLGWNAEFQYADLSCRQQRIDGDLADDAVPEIGEKAQAYVMQTTPKGCFLRVSRIATARVQLRNLSDGFIPDPQEAFPAGRLVIGKVQAKRPGGRKGKGEIDFDLRESELVSDENRLSLETIEVGKKYTGTVTGIENYGVFVRITNSSVKGLVHWRECSEKPQKDVLSRFNVDDLVKVFVQKKIVQEGKKGKLSLSMKPSYFVDDEEEEATDSETDDMEVDDEPDTMAEVVEENASEPTSGDDDDDSSSSDEDEEIGAYKSGRMRLDTNVGFDWEGDSHNKTGTKRTLMNGDDSDEDERQAVTDDPDESEDDLDDEEEDLEAKSNSHRARKTQAARRREESDIAQREQSLADGTADQNPESSADFERLLSGNPNSSELWIKFMAFHLSLADIAAARRVAEMAFTRIEFREENEKMNVWCALLTLEVKYGTEESVLDTLNRACQQVNPKHIHLRLCEILEREGSDASLERAEELFKKTCKKFRTKKTSWLAYIEFLLKRNNRHNEALDISKRALLSIPTYKHVLMMSRFGQLLFQHGKNEQARTVFETLLEKNPKRLDLLNVFLDQEIKHGNIETARKVFAGATDAVDRKMKLSDKQMKKLFKRWYTFEETHGSDESQERVKTAARLYVEKSAQK